jgi:flagellar hook-length control protein FliK
VDAIQLLISGQAQAQTDPGAAGRKGQADGEAGKSGAFAALLSRSQQGGAAGADAIPASRDGRREAGDGVSRLALTVGGEAEAAGFPLDGIALDGDPAADAAADDAAEALAAAGQTLAAHRSAEPAAGTIGRTPAAQTAAGAAAQLAAHAVRTGAAGSPAAGQEGAAEEPGLFDAGADAAKADAADEALQRARKSAFEDFETAWRRLASSRRLDVDAATLKLKPAGGEDAQALRAQPVTAPVDGGVSMLAKTDGGEGPTSQVQFGLDGAKTAERAGSAEAAHRTPSAQTASPTEQVAMQIRRAAAGGADRITLQLHPRDLGSVEVRLEFGDNNAVRASVLVERPDTLEMLQRDSRQLQRALNEAGLDADGGSLSFDLRGQGNQGGSADGGDGRSGGEGEDGLPFDEETAGAGDAVDEVATYAVAIADGRLDIRI